MMNQVIRWQGGAAAPPDHLPPRLPCVAGRKQFLIRIVYRSGRSKLRGLGTWIFSTSFQFTECEGYEVIIEKLWKFSMGTHVLSRNRFELRTVVPDITGHLLFFGGCPFLFQPHRQNLPPFRSPAGCGIQRSSWMEVAPPMNLPVQ